ncbi:hypothetical protein BDV28DRAFT_80909 [Aspergillus coremiiformis]|uniref:Uncharacterized protein n=1 Tax=Aspergillus coremiiformis TaxID=138285 RepID=A0A5N6ZAR3_9EURO|nr:hypothetical protein BDV28DRAFT_80909 [Aspergillus coremiiformis]
MAPFGETIAVIDKSGKVVSTSKQLFGVFSQAKNAYRDRKAQLQSERNAIIAEREALKALQNYTIDDSPSVASSRRSHSRYHSDRSHHSRHYYDDDYGHERDLHSVVSRPDSYYARPQDLVRRNTHHEVTMRGPQARPTTSRSKSDAHVDMDLAYGDYNPHALAKRPYPQTGQLQKIEDPELNGLVNRAQWLIEEAHCVHHSATATIAHLQKNPDAMAAVALTLAEISNITAKMAPAALSTLKSAAPAVFALLASPQFLIAAGVGLTATIVMFGGYKIIKQMAGAGNEVRRGPDRQPEEPVGMDDIMEFNTECLSGVEMWRRGVADVADESIGTSVDGELITPTAAMMSGIDVTTARMTRDPRFKFDDDEESRASSHRSRRSRPPRSRAPTRVDDRPESYVGSKAPTRSFFGVPSKAPSRVPSKAPSKAPSKVPSKASSRAPSRAPSKSESHRSHHSDRDAQPKEKKKLPSKLRLMFTA